jgi:regulator of CtrA degradation
MSKNLTFPLLTRKVIDSLHVEAMVLADEARACFDGAGQEGCSGMEPVDRVIFSCEALKVTTRLMHCVAWLLSHRALLSGDDLQQRPVTLGKAPETIQSTLLRLPKDAARIVEASEQLYQRIHRVNDALRRKEIAETNPAHMLQKELERAF